MHKAPPLDALTVPTRTWPESSKMSYDQVWQLHTWIGFQENCDYLIILRTDTHYKQANTQ